MFIKEIKLNNFRNFVGTHSFTFDKLNLIIGKIGTGKSTLGRIAISFALYGDSEVPVATLPTRGKEKSCSVELLIAKNEHLISIQRQFPTKITIKVDNKEVLDGATTPDKEKWIVQQFGDLNYFRRFRMIDLRQGVNLLDEGPTVLKKTLVSFHENMLNNIKARLQERKTLYDKFNRDRAVIYKHYPSEQRLRVLSESLAYNIEELNNIYYEKRNADTRYNKSYSDLSVDQNILTDLNKTFEEINSGNSCPLCKNSLSFDVKHNLLLDTEKQIKVLQSKIAISVENVKANKEKSISYDQQMEKLRKIQQKINHYKSRLEARLKQSEYKYTNKDVLLVSNAIKYIDKFYSSFIMTHVRTLEPIINSIISKIGFEAEFKLDKSSNFSIVITKDDKEFSYKDLSSGQRLLLSIAFQVSMLIERGDLGFIVADEGFNNLDNDSATVLYELFKDLPFQVISILHRFENVPADVKIINLGDSNV